MKTFNVCVLLCVYGEEEYGEDIEFAKFNTQTKAEILVSNFYFSYPKKLLDGYYFIHHGNKLPPLHSLVVSTNVLATVDLFHLWHK